MSGQMIKRLLVRRLVRIPGAGLPRTQDLLQSQTPTGTPGGKCLRLFEADNPLASGETREPEAGVLGTENSSASTPGTGSRVHRRTLQNRAPGCAYGDLG